MSENLLWNAFFFINVHENIDFKMPSCPDCLVSLIKQLWETFINTFSSVMEIIVITQILINFYLQRSLFVNLNPLLKLHIKQRTVQTPQPLKRCLHTYIIVLPCQRGFNFELHSKPCFAKNRRGMKIYATLPFWARSAKYEEALEEMLNAQESKIVWRI